jgi:hypothetical protein
MFRGKNKIILLLTVILTSAVLWLMYSDGNSTINKRLRDFSVNDTAAIDKILLTYKNDTISIERNKQTNQWILNRQYKVYPPYIARLLYTINKVDIKSPVSKKESEILLQQLKTQGIKCEFFSNNEITKAYQLIENTNNAATTMALINLKTMELYSTPFYTHVPGYNGVISNHYVVDLNYWKDKTVFSYDEAQIKSITVEHSWHPEKSFELNITAKNKYTIKSTHTGNNLKNVDTSAIRQYLTYFHKLTYEKNDSIAPDNKQHICTITVKESNGYVNSVAFFVYNDLIAENQTVNTLFLSAKLPNGQHVSVKPNLFGKIFQDLDYFVKK